MKLSVMSFTRRGMELSHRVAEAFLPDEVCLFTKCKSEQETALASGVSFETRSLGAWTKEQMDFGTPLLFIGACGIAVRAIAPYVKDKLQDSPVLVMDETGAYVIPLLSGHVGGANELALRLANKLGALPVITTATDQNHLPAVDVFAKRNDLHIENRDGIAKVSAKVLKHEPVSLFVERGHLEYPKTVPTAFFIVDWEKECPPQIAVTTDPEKCGTLLTLRPKEYVLGVGCKKGKTEKELDEFIKRVLAEAGISLEQIAAVASIDQKKEEAGLVAFCQKYRLRFLTYFAEDLQKVEGDFTKSAFVREQVGVDNVCERAAVLASGKNGSLIRKKQAEDGMTAAIAKREWSVSFDE